MISELSAKIAAYLFKKSAISEEDKELYSYGFFVILSRVLFLFVSAIFGLIFHVLPESLTFFVFFCLIRSYAGGIHASSELRCTVLTSIAIFACVLGIKLSETYNADYFLLSFFALSLVVVILFSPLDTAEKPLSFSERKRFKTLSLIISAVIAAFALLFYFLNIKSYSFAFMFSMILESVLLAAGKIKQKAAEN